MIAQLPNAFTVLRIVLVAPIAYFILSDQWSTVLVLLLVAGLSDVVDGALARRFNWESRFGALADPIADKLTFGIVVILLTVKGLFPLWLMLVVIGRDLVILGGAGLYALLINKLDISPSNLSKLNTVVQVALPFLIIVGLNDWMVSEWAKVFVDPWGFYLAGAMALASGIDYVIVWSRRAIEQWPNRGESTHSDSVS